MAQTAPIRIHHLTESLCGDDTALRRALPEVNAAALDLCAGAAADAAVFEPLLARDPALAGQLIAVAGGGLFAARADISTVRDAVMHLGLEGLRDVVVLLTTNGMTLSVPGFEAVSDNLRRRALAGAAAAPLVTRALNVPSGHDFLIGLMHDIGERVLLQRCAEEGVIVPRLLDDASEAPLILETLHRDHPTVGAALCRAWRLPAAVAEAAELHHDRRSDRKARLPAQLAAASDVIAAHVISGAPEGSAGAHPQLVELGLDARAISSIIAETAALLPRLLAIGSTAQPAR